MNTNGLKECAHCGSDQCGVTTYPRKGLKPVSRAHCLQCNMSTSAHENLDHAKTIWNTRNPAANVTPSGVRVVVAEESDWVKIVAIMMFREGVMKTSIPVDILRSFAAKHEGHVVGAEFDPDGTMRLEITTPELAEEKLRGKSTKE